MDERCWLNALSPKKGKEREQSNDSFSPVFKSSEEGERKKKFFALSRPALSFTGALLLLLLLSLPFSSALFSVRTEERIIIVYKAFQFSSVFYSFTIQ